ncbi:MAG: phosphatidate cytidylyltransferase [Bacteroidetes bacterium]|uniref:Phosphatidate cytidylyltransferase n=1 Tax=Candidatus Cryptobacteroides excrementavium TaxID=2840759 RepID=A0A9D9J671_9BACT|nr:phosphatidate cytidylyltransferase [Candidatus Cryptobacteroides excrementavium]
MKNLILRTLSGILLIAAVVAALLLGKYFFCALMIVIMVCMMVEFFRMTMGSEYRFSQYLSMFAAATLFILTFLYMGFNLPGRLVMLAFIPIFLIMANSLYVKDKTDFGKFAFIYTALLYIAVPMTLTNFAVFRFIGQYDGMLLLCFFAIIWASDVGAYVFGITLGQKYGKKLFPAVSPKKSWIGFWGGFVLAVAVAAGLHYGGLFNYPLHHCLIMAALMNIAGVYGDLIESQWKRHYAIKDSGSVIPGHGGIWDRFDSALMAIPAGVIYLVVLNIL